MTYLKAPLYLWALPSTLIGLVLLLWCRPVHVAWSYGALWVQTERLVPSWASGQTWGFAVLCSAKPTARLVEHELHHVDQQIVLGPLFLLAYPLASLIAVAQGGHCYRDNWFERHARGET